MFETPSHEIACAILAGGRSARLGKDKVVLELGGRPLINQVFDKARRVFENVIILSNHHGRFEGIDAPVLPDALPVKGSVVGIVSALLYTGAPYVCVLACDMPNLSEKALAYMTGEVHGEDIIIPRTVYGYEPLHAIYGRSCISHFLRSIGRNRMKIGGIFPYVSLKELRDETKFSQGGRPVFININTEEDLRAASKFYAPGQGKLF